MKIEPPSFDSNSSPKSEKKLRRKHDRTFVSGAVSAMPTEVDELDELQHWENSGTASSKNDSFECYHIPSTSKQESCGGRLSDELVRPTLELCGQHEDTQSVNGDDLFLSCEPSQKKRKKRKHQISVEDTSFDNTANESPSPYMENKRKKRKLVSNGSESEVLHFFETKQNFGGSFSCNDDCVDDIRPSETVKSNDALCNEKSGRKKHRKNSNVEQFASEPACVGTDFDPTQKAEVFDSMPSTDATSAKKKKKKHKNKYKEVIDLASQCINEFTSDGDAESGMLSASDLAFSTPETKRQGGHKSSAEISNSDDLAHNDRWHVEQFASEPACVGTDFDPTQKAEVFDSMPSTDATSAKKKKKKHKNNYKEVIDLASQCINEFTSDGDAESGMLSASDLAFSTPETKRQGGHKSSAEISNSDDLAHNDSLAETSSLICAGQSKRKKKEKHSNIHDTNDCVEQICVEKNEGDEVQNSLLVPSDIQQLAAEASKKKNKLEHVDRSGAASDCETHESVTVHKKRSRQRRTIDVMERSHSELAMTGAVEFEGNSNLDGTQPASTSSRTPENSSSGTCPRGKKTKRRKAALLRRSMNLPPAYKHFDSDVERTGSTSAAADSVNPLHARNCLHHLKTSKEALESGLTCNTGKWTAAEDEQLKINWSKIIEDCPISPPHFLLMSNLCSDPDTRSTIRSFIDSHNVYIRLATNINRTLYNVYARARKLFHPGHKGGQFSLNEKNTLMDLVADYGPKWQLIGSKMGRSGSACYETYRHWASKFTPGRFTLEEDERLRTIVQEHIQSSNPDEMFENLPWTSIAKEMGNRTYNQCRRRWLTISLVDKRKLSLDDKYQLIGLLRKSNYQTEQDIDWKSLWKDHFCDLPSPFRLREIFTNMVKYYMSKSGESSLQSTLERMETVILPYLSKHQSASRLRDIENEEPDDDSS